jgi:nucleotide-binding universal stress UspA family protein
VLSPISEGVGAPFHSALVAELGGDTVPTPYPFSAHHARKRVVNGSIICVVADPDESRALVRVAGDLGRRLGSELVLVAVADDGDTVLQDGRPVTRALLRERLEGLAAASGVGGSVHIVVGGGDPIGVVVDVAHDEEAAVIVLGSAPGLLGRTFRSPLARGLAEQAPCPVLVAPPSRPPGPVAVAAVADSGGAR